MYAPVLVVPASAEPSVAEVAAVRAYCLPVVVREKGSENMNKPDATSRINYTLPKSVSPSKYATVDTSPLKCTVVEGGTTFDIELKD